MVLYGGSHLSHKPLKYSVIFLVEVEYCQKRNLLQQHPKSCVREMRVNWSPLKALQTKALCLAVGSRFGTHMLYSNLHLQPRFCKCGSGVIQLKALSLTVGDAA